MWRHNMYINVIFSRVSQWNVDWWPNMCARSRPIPERMSKIIYSSPYASHETAISHIIKYWYCITYMTLYHYESIISTLMHIYSRNGAVPVILLCIDHIFLVFEHTYSSDTRQHSFLQIPIPDLLRLKFTSHWPSISITTLSTVSTWDYVEMVRVFLPRNDHVVLQNILIVICFALISLNSSARYVRLVKYVTLYRIRPCN